MSTPQLTPEPSPSPTTQQLPAVLVATPSDLPEALSSDTRFWMPGWGDCVRLLGWRWLVIIGLLVLAVALGWAVTRWTGFVLGMSGIIIKTGLFGIGTAITLVIWLRRNATRLRTDPFCIHCGYSLEGLADGSHCPECGRRFRLSVISEYRRDPHWFIERYRSHGAHPTDNVVLHVPEPGATVAVSATPQGEA